MKISTILMMLLMVSSAIAATPQLYDDRGLPVTDRPVRYYDYDEKFDLSVGETAFAGNLRIKFDRIDQIVCVTVPCPSHPTAVLRVSRTDWDINAEATILLEAGKSIAVFETEITLLALDDKATLVVSETDSTIKHFTLGEKFDLDEGETATGEGLSINFVRKDGIACALIYPSDCESKVIAVLDVSSTYSDAVAVRRLQLGVGESETVFGLEITLLALDAQATLVVNKDSDNRYSLGEKFELALHEDATVEDLTISFFGHVQSTCEPGELCDPMPAGEFIVTVPYAGTSSADAILPQGYTILRLGETKELYGYSITLLALGNTATLVVNKAKPVKTPVCSHIGTEREGWYIDGQLVKLDNCVCRAVCRSDAYFSSCNGQLIMKTVCDDSTTVGYVPTMIGPGPEPRPSSGYVPGSTGVAVEPDVPTSGSPGIVVDDGSSDPIVYVSSAVGRAQPAMQVESVSLVEAERPYYEVKGKTKTTFLWIFPMEKETTVYVDAESYEILE